MTHPNSLPSVRDEERSWSEHCIFQRFFCSCPLGNFLTGRRRLNAGRIVVTFHLPFFTVPGIRPVEVFYATPIQRRWQRCPWLKLVLDVRRWCTFLKVQRANHHSFTRTLLKGFLMKQLSYWHIKRDLFCKCNNTFLELHFSQMSTHESVKFKTLCPFSTFSLTLTIKLPVFANVPLQENNEWIFLMKL